MMILNVAIIEDDFTLSQFLQKKISNFNKFYKYVFFILFAKLI